MGERPSWVNHPSLTDRFRARRLDRQIDNAQHYLEILSEEVDAPRHCREMRSLLKRELDMVAYALHKLETDKASLYLSSSNLAHRRTS